MPNPYVNKVVVNGETKIDLTDTTATAADVASGNVFYNAAGARTIGTAKSSYVFYGKVDSTSTSTAYTATIEGVTEYFDGLTILLKNGVVTSAAGFTIDINGLGAKHAYSNMAAATAETTAFNVNYTIMFIYDSTRVEGGGWIYYRGYYSDSNSIAYQIRTNSTSLKTTDRTRYYRILFTSADGTHWVPANTQYDNSATSTKTVNQRPIDPFGRIVYMSGTTSVSAEAAVGTGVVWDQYALTLGYSFNRTGAALELTTQTPVYVKCAPQSDGSVIMDSTTPYVQELPNTEDGKVYIFLGIAYSATQVELVKEHPIYYYKGGSIRQWVNAYEPTIPTKVSDLQNDSGFITTETDPTVPSWAKASTKPTYTASEVGALPSTTTYVSSFNGSTGAITYSAPVSSVNGQTGAVSLSIPTATSDLTNDSGYISTETDPTVPSWAKASSKPSYNFSEIGSTPTTLSGYGITNAYTKTEVDGLVSGVLHYKGTKATVSALPSTGNTTGDTWHVTADGSEWAWDGTTWQELGTAVDLSNYVTTDDSRLSDARTPTAHNQSLSTITDADDIKAIEALSGTSGLLKKTAANTWSLDTTTYVNTNDSRLSDARTPTAHEQALSTITGADDLKAIEALSGTSGLLKKTAANTWTLDTNSYLTTETDPTVPAWAKASSKPTYTASEVGALPATTSIPSKTSDLTNDSGFITTETDPTVPAWAKAASKPSYTATEVGALPSNTTYVSTFNGQSGAVTYTAPVSSVNGQTGAVTLSIPTATSDLTNDSGYITTETDPTVPAWAKASSKPSYTATEVGALPSNTTYVSSVNGMNGAVTITDSDENVLQTSVGSSYTGYYPLLFSSSNGSSSTTAGAFKDNSLIYQPSTSRLTTGKIQVGSTSSPGTISLGNLSFTAPTTTTDNTITLPNATGTVALTSDVPSRYNSSTNPNGYLTMADLPIWDGSVT